MKKLRAILAALVLAAPLTGCEVLKSLGLAAEAKVECDKDGCTVSGHVHTAPK